MWFKVDDKFPAHRKARSVRRSHPAKRRDAGPLGLWVLAGAWSDDGFVPTEVLEDWDDDAHEMAERLVSAGLWFAESLAGEPGYRFHDWLDMNPDPAHSGAFGNHLRWHVKRGKIAPDCAFCQADDRPDIAPDSPPIGDDDRPDIAPRIATRIASGIADPTRPDPTIEQPTADSLTLIAPEVTKVRRGTRLREDWQPDADLLTWAANEFPWLPVAEQTESFRDHFTAKPGAAGLKLDWRKTWRNWMRTAADRTPAWKRSERILVATGTDDIFTDADDLDD